MAAFTPHDFYLKYIGKYLNDDKVAGYQCVDTYKRFRAEIGDPNPYRAIGGDGWAYQIWERRNVSGDAERFNFYPFTSASNLKDGDWCLWKYGAIDCPYSHVAMFRKDNGNGTGVFLGQNQGSPYVNQATLSYSGILGALRWKEWDVPDYDDSQLINETGRATFTVDRLIVRKGTPTGDDTGKRLNTGDQQDYTQKWVGNGHRYISWISGGVRYFVAVSNSETQGVEPWATFEAIPTNATFDESKLEQEHGLAKFRNEVPIIVHTGAPTGEDSGKRKQKGDEQVYSWKYVGLGHRWIVWEEHGVKYYCAVSGTEERPEEGSENQWATFSEVPTEAPEEPEEPEAPEEEWTIESPELEPELYQPTEGWLEHNGVKLVYDVVTVDEYKYKAPFVMKPEYPVVHNAGTNFDPSAKSLNKSMRNAKTTQKSWHFSVDEATIVQGLPLNRNGWHAGDGRDGDGNRKGIAIEICRDTLNTYEDKFLQAEKNASVLLADLMYQKGFKEIRKHQDFSGKYCPHKTLDKGWERFVELVNTKRQELEEFLTPKVDDNPQKPEEPTEDENNKRETLLDLLIELIQKILNFFK